MNKYLNFSKVILSTSFIFFSLDCLAGRVRLGIVKPVFDVEISTSAGKAIDSIDDGWGVSLSYVKLTSQEMGYSVGLVYSDFKNGTASFAIARVEGNLAFAVSDKVDIKGGLNYSDITRSSSSSDISPAIGYQAGAGLMFSENVGADLSYIVMNQKNSSTDLNYKESGYELGIHYTF